MTDWNHYWTRYTIEEVRDKLIELSDGTRYYINRGARGWYVKTTDRLRFPMYQGIGLWDLSVENMCGFLNDYGARPVGK